MGIPLDNFVTDVDEELICSICKNVLDNPLQAEKCEHTFCNFCINEWLKFDTSCPIDRLVLTKSELKSAPRIIRNLLNKLSIYCEYKVNGCNEIIKLENCASHIQDCEFNPSKPIFCQDGCGTILVKTSDMNHNCIKALRNVIKDQSRSLETLEQKYADLRSKYEATSEEVTILKDIVRNITSNLYISSDIFNEEEMFRLWIGNLPIAQEVRWGGIISTPDTLLQAVVKRSILDSGCPPAHVLLLMENAHERRWPPGLRSLEARQTNRYAFESFTIRRVPNKQAIIILATENEHMSSDMVTQPGIVMIFAHGIT